MINSLRVDRDVAIVLRDGVQLQADIYRPDDGARHPAILFRSYNRMYGRRMPLLLDLVNAGYAYVNSDLRGRGGSGGDWKPEDNLIVEGPDGYDTVEWIARQGWCDGRVGMIGVSHAALFSYMTAIENPPHLKAIAPWTGDFNEMFVPPRTGGVTSFITTLIWLPRESADVIDRLERQGHDVGEMRKTLAWAMGHPEELKNYLPLKEIPFSRLGRIGELLEWRLNPINQEELDRIRKYDRISVPCFHECGWYDGAGWSQFENFCNLQEQAATEIARQGQHMVVGPWPHGMLFQSSLGGLNFGYTADSLGSGLHQLQIAFFDKYVRGKEIDLPTIRYFVMGRNQWRTADSWPLPETDWQRYYLHSNGNANSAAGDGALSREKPGDESPDQFVYDPHEPVPTAGGPLIGALPLPGILAGPLDQYHVEKRNDVLCYTTQPFEQDLEITGPLQLHLFAATSAVDTAFTPKLVHVYPDSQAYNLAEGIIRASGRKLTGEREAVKPGEVTEYTITLGNTSQLIPRGHRLRIDVSSSNFPLFDRNMNTGNPIGVDAKGVVATQTIYHQENYASYIDLPVIPA